MTGRTVYQFTLTQWRPDPPGTTRETRDGTALPGTLLTESRVGSESAEVTARAMRAVADELAPPVWKFWRRVRRTVRTAKAV